MPPLHRLNLADRGISMDIDSLDRDARLEIVASIADLYYNQKCTKVELAERFSTTRFKVAKLLQEAEDEQIVEIRVNHPGSRNHALERRLCESFPLKKAIVVDTKLVSYVDGLMHIGQAGATRLIELLREDATIGLTWGKSIQSAVCQLPHSANRGVKTVQLVGNFASLRPTSESRELVKCVSAAYSGEAYYLNAPLYVRSDEVRAGLAQEPDIARTLDVARRLDVVLTGVGASSSLPTNNVLFRDYLTEEELAHPASYPGSLFGYVLDAKGEIADVSLNRRIMGASIEDIVRAPHRLAISSGRNKVEINRVVVEKGLINELITDAETATLMLAM